jgi:hypothetical protein
VISGSELDVFDFGQGSSITAKDNGGCGLALVSGGLLLVVAPPPLFGSGINVITLQNNAACGIFMPATGFIESPLGAARIIVEGSPVGLMFGDNSGANIIGGLRVAKNGVGVLGDGGGSMTFGSMGANVSFIQGNTTDVDLRFGSRATFCSMTVGTVRNDGTALARTLPACPSPPL